MKIQKTLSMMALICCLLCFLFSNTTVLAQTTTQKYSPNNYNNDIFSCLTEEYVSTLQDEVDYITQNNPSITEDELNIYIMNSIQSEYYSQIKARTNVPTSQSILNDAEKTLFASHPIKGLYVLSCANTATTWTNNLFNSSVTYLGNGDAYRHAFWQALIAEAYGTSFAKQWGDAHESTSSGVDKEMDLRNNDIGRNLGASIKGYQNIEARLSSALLTKISNGELWRVVNGQLCATDGTGRK
ncbi:MAG: DUF6973 domain-containing protein [Agathobacter sp.]